MKIAKLRRPKMANTQSESILISISFRLRIRICALGLTAFVNPRAIGLMSVPGVNSHSYLMSIWHNIILISVVAKKRPGQACLPCPKAR